MSPRDIETARDQRVAWRGNVILALLLLATMAFPGCGGSNGHDGSARSDPPKRTISFPIKQETHEDIVAAVEACREGVSLGTWLPSTSKSDLDGICNKGLGRGLTEVRQYGEQICGELMFTIPSSRASEKPRIFAACEARTEKFVPTMHGTFPP